jgi:hypothetical protein
LADISKLYPSLLARDNILISSNPCENSQHILASMIYFLSIQGYRKTQQWHNSQVWTNQVLPISTYVICTQLTDYFSTTCWYLPKIMLNDKMRRFFKNPWCNSFVLRKRWRWKKIWIQTANSSVAYELWNYKLYTKGAVDILLSRCGQFIMGKLNSSLL